MSDDNLNGKIRVAVLTVSDRASAPDADPAYDKSGPAIREILADYSVFACIDHATAPDNVQAIQGTVNKWVRAEIDWIVTTGGTGFGIRDQTPEAITPLLTRSAPGLVHLLLASSLKHTPMAALSRPVAGTISQSTGESGRETLVVTLPGSVKAVRENLTALLDSGVVVHAIDLMKGGDGNKSGQGVHGASDVSHSHRGHGHHHHHHHPRDFHDRDHARHEGHHHGHDHDHKVLSHDPSQAVSTRYRTSPYPIVSFEDALDMVYKNIEHLPVVNLPVNASLRGHILAEDVYASADFPPTKTTSVDGYALRSSDPAGIYTVLTSQSHPQLLSSTSQEVLPEGCIYRINTGGALPQGADTVIMVEDTKVAATYPEAPSSDTTPTGPPGEEWKVETLIPAPPSHYDVRQPGSDVRRGDLVMKKGERITSSGGEVGTLVFIGKKEVRVYKKPVVALLSTGNEIRDLEGVVAATGNGEGDWKSWDTNRPSLTASLEGMGYEVVDLGIVPDEIDAHVHALEKGLALADIILTTGGTSMGPMDLLKPVIERKLGGEVKFGRVSVKPGKPTTFAVVPVKAKSQSEPDGISRFKPLFALPGNPASALVTFNIFVVPALRKLGGWEFSEEGCELPKVNVEVQQPMRLDPRTEFHRVILRSGDFTNKNDGMGGKLKAYSTGGQRSSRVASLNGANGLVILPQRKDGEKEELGKGEVAEAVIIGDIL